MKYALTVGNEIKVGPRDWYAPAFNNFLKTEGIEATIPVFYESKDPVIISDNVRIVPVVEAPHPQYNSRIEQLAGPTNTVTATEVTSVYGVALKSVESVRNELKAQAASVRYNREVKGTTTELQGKTVFVPTDRETRNTFMQALLLLPEGQTTVWKFPENDLWLTISKPELQLLVTAAQQHISAAFAWEQSKVAEIESATDLETLAAIVLE